LKRFIDRIFKDRLVGTCAAVIVVEGAFFGLTMITGVPLPEPIAVANGLAAGGIILATGARMTWDILTGKKD
jgi:hypothetical protein